MNVKYYNSSDKCVSLLIQSLTMKMEDIFFLSSKWKFYQMCPCLSVWDITNFFQAQPSCFIVSCLITSILAVCSPLAYHTLCFWWASLVTGAWSCHFQFMEFSGGSPVSARVNWLALKDSSLRVPKGHFFLNLEHSGKWFVVGIDARVLKKVDMERQNPKKMYLIKHSNLDHSKACIMIKVFQKADRTAKTNWYFN